MCDHPAPAGVQEMATGWFRKNNLAKDEAYVFDIIVTKCQCGKGMVARVVNGTNWTKCEKETK